MLPAARFKHILRPQHPSSCSSPEQPATLVRSTPARESSVNRHAGVVVAVVFGVDVLEAAVVLVGAVALTASSSRSMEVVLVFVVVVFVVWACAQPQTHSSSSSSRRQLVFILRIACEGERESRQPKHIKHCQQQFDILTRRVDCVHSKLSCSRSPSY